MENRIKNMEEQLEGMKHLLIKLNKNIEEVNIKIDNLSVHINDDLVPECKKMGSHIDFVEHVYDTVKHPLGYLCNKIKRLSGRNQKKYTLTDVSSNEVS